MGNSESWASHFGDRLVISRITEFQLALENLVLQQQTRQIRPVE